MQHSATHPHRLDVWGDSLLNKLPARTRKSRKRQASKKRRVALQRDLGTRELMSMNEPRLEALRPITPAGPDVEAAIDFYVRELGFEVRLREGSPTEAAIVHRDGVELWLQKTDDRHWASQTAYHVRVLGVEALYQECLERGGKAIHPNGKLQKKPWGSTEFSILDPFGVCITFYQFPE